MEKLLYEGKGKKVFATADPTQVILELSDNLTAFNGKKRGNCPGKGVLNNYINEYIMQQLVAGGIKVAWLQRLGARRALVRNLAMLPLEFVVRNFAAGSLLREGKYQHGAKLDPPLTQLYLKDDALGDPLIDLEYIVQRQLAPTELVRQGQAQSLAINSLLVPVFSRLKLHLVDFKLEFGVLAGELYLGDEISADSCRFWHKESGEVFDKDLFRLDLGDIKTGYTKLSQLLGIKLPPAELDLQP